MSSDEPASSHNGVAAIILAGGLGTRMRSRTPKELQPLAGRPLLDYVLRAAFSVQPQQVIVVLGPAKAEVVDMLPDGCDVAWQQEPLGTGHAVAQALPLLKPAIHRVVVLLGDHPLLEGETVASLVDAAESSQALVTVLTVLLDDPARYGRLKVRDGRITGIVEARDDTATYTGPVEVNSGVSCFDRAWLEQALPTVPRSAAGEYYLTSLVELAANEARPVAPVLSTVAPPEVAHGVNDRVELAAAEAVMRRRINERLMRSGVTIVDPNSTFIDDTVTIGQDSRIEPFTTISGRTTIEEDCVIGPQTIVRDCQVGLASVVEASVIEGAILGARTHVGPFSHLRQGVHLADDVHVGNFAELKNAVVGSHTRVGHFSYVGDSELGADVNIGAGTITANFDGVAKHRTVIGDRAFIGSDTVLRAPVEIGPDGRTGAGSVVTRDVAPGSTVVGMPARPIGSRRRERGVAKEDGI